MKRILLVVIATVFSIHQAYTQSVQHPDIAKIEITWRPIENNYLGKEQTLSVFTISGEIPATGWRIYFNYGRTITPLVANSSLQTGHINGGLYFLYPADDFKAITTNNKVEVHCLSNSWVVNSSDAPQGFYWVWDDAPGKGIPLNNFKVLEPADITKLKRFAGDKVSSAEDLYNLNARAATGNSQVCKIFPKPVSYQELPGDFNLNSSTIVSFDPAFIAEAALLGSDLQILLGKTVKQVLGTAKRNGIALIKDASINNNGYRLLVKPNGIIVSAANSTGIFYGIQSLKILINPSFYNPKNQVSVIPVQCTNVADAPAFDFRGVMLDVARNFQSKDEIIKLIDLLALYKFNTLHLHLNDDEGWRLEIKSLPELTSVGSKRGHSLNEDNSLIPAYGSGPLVNASSGSGYYSKGQFIEILKYATQRHINVIPEVETPGHARAAVKAMAARYKKFIALGDSLNANKYLLQSFHDSSVYHSVQQWNDNVIDPALPSTYNFITTVTDDIIAMYTAARAPLTTIHYGGDETPAGVWELSPAFKALREKNSVIKTPADLWDYFFERVNGIAKQRGLYVSGWEETGLVKTTVNGKKRWQPNPKFLTENFHVNVWNNMLGNEDLGYRLANAGYKVVLSFVTNFYFDMAYQKNFNEPGFNWGGFIDLEQPFKMIPFNYLQNQKTDYLGRLQSKDMLLNAEKITETGKLNIVGIQGLLWTETVKTPGRLEYMYLPRLMALAERAWAKQPGWMTEADSLKAAKEYATDWSGFLQSTGRELVRLDHYTGGYQYRIPLPAFKVSNGLVYANTDITGFTIRYTTDGSIPENGGKLYKQPIPYSNAIILRAFATTGRGGLTVKVAEGLNNSVELKR